MQKFWTAWALRRFSVGFDNLSHLYQGRAAFFALVISEIHWHMQVQTLTSEKGPAGLTMLRRCGSEKLVAYLRALTESLRERERLIGAFFRLHARAINFQ
jgi:hypothetical protein